MNEVITIGVDLAKSVFQIHGVDGSGGVVILASCGDLECCPSSKNSRPAWLAWRRAPQRITGHGN